jgi:hypothetical protein
VTQETGGATISCENGSIATISDGANGLSKADLDAAASTILDAIAESSAKSDALYNAFNKTAGGVCRDTIFLGIRPDGTIGEIIGAADCNGDCYRDNDLDLYGDPQNSLSACIGLPEGYVWDNTDCDDTDASINPAVAEISNDDIDQDCSGADYIPRFTDNGDGTKTDILTGLIWANTSYTGTWENAKTFAAVLNSGEYGLTDGSAEGDWRLPTLEELQERGTIPATSWGSGIWPAGVYWSSNADDIGAPPTTTFFGFSEWTSTELNDAGDNVWALNVDWGGFIPVNKVCDYWWGCNEPAYYAGRPVRNN